MKKISCGGIIFSPNNKLLISRPRWDSSDWNIPKGEIQSGESFEQCAFREIEEETGITQDMYKSVVDLGLFRYLKKKDVYLYHIILNQLPEKLFCNSFYEENGKIFPEMVAFKWIDWNEKDKYMSKSILAVLKEITLI